jgi:hypothetical protein
MSLEQWQSNQPALPTLPPAAATLVDWAKQADAAYQLAQRISGTSFVPQQFRGKPEEAAAAMLAGSEVGLSPMASLGAFDVIQGRATPRAITLRAIALSRGCEIVVDESSPARCKMRGRRRGDSEWTSVTWDIGRAQAMGLTQKQQWKQQPVAMLLARATAELCRLIAADAVLGLAYSAEELYDDTDKPAAPQRVQRARVQRLPQPPPEPEQDEPDDVPSQQEQLPEPALDDEPDGITPAQLTALNAALTGDLGITDRQEKLDYLSSVLDRSIGSSRDLTKDEASQVLDTIRGQDAPGVPAGATSPVEEPPLDGMDWPEVKGPQQ